MVKIFFKDENSSYDDKKDILIIRNSAFKNKKELKKILEHELTHHYYRKKGILNLIFEIKEILKS